MDKNWDWFAERINESSTGKLLVPNSLIDKYRKQSGNYTDCNMVIRNIIINECRNAGTGI